MGGPWEEFSTQASAAPWEEFASPTSEWRQKAGTEGRLVKDLQREFILSQGGFKDRAKQYVKDAVPYVRPVVEGVGAGLGGVLGAGGGFLAGAPTVVGAPVTATMGGVAGAGLGYAAGKNIMDTMEGNWVSGPTEAAARAVRDIGTGAMYEMGGQIAAPVLAPVFKGAVNTVSALSRGAVSPVKTLKGGVDNAGAALARIKDNIVKKSAARQIENSVTRAGVVAEQSALNQAEYEALQQRMPGFQLTPAQATDDAARLKLQQDLQFKSTEAKTALEAQGMNNRVAIGQHLDNNIPQGSIEDFLAGMQREADARAAGVATQRQGIAGTDKELSGQALREMAQKEGGSLKRQANVLYDQVPQDMPVAGSMTYGQLMKERSDVGQAIRQAKASGDFSKAFDLSSRMGELENILKQAGQPKNDMFGVAVAGQGSQADVQALRKANDFYRDTYVPTVRQGATANVLKTNGTGGSTIDNALVGKQYFQAGDKGLEAANSFNRTFAANPEAKQALTDYAKNDLLTYATSPNTGELVGTKVNSWIADHTNALNKLGLQDEFTGVQKALQSQAELSGFAKVIGNTDPHQAMKVLFSGANGKDSIRTMMDLHSVVKSNPTALAGLKRSFADMMMQETELAKRSMKGDYLVSSANLKKFWVKYEPAMKFLYTPNEFKAVGEVRRAFEMENRMERVISGVSGSQTRDVADVANQGLSKLAQWSWQGRAARMLLDWAKVSKSEGATNYILRAQFDPEVAQELKGILNVGKNGNEAAAKKAFNAAVGHSMASAMPAVQGQDELAVLTDY